jgi:hypothetical protein
MPFGLFRVITCNEKLLYEKYPLGLISPTVYYATGLPFFTSLPFVAKGVRSGNDLKN